MGVKALASTSGDEYLPQIRVDGEVVWEGDACATAEEAAQIAKDRLTEAARNVGTAKATRKK